MVWRSSNTKAAAVDSTGKVTAVNYGRAVITASAADGSGKSSSCRIKVPYQIKYKLNNGKNNKKNPAFYYQQEIALRDPSRRGYLFKGWYQKKNFKKKIKKITKSSRKNYTLYAKWEKVKVKASFIKKLRNKQSGKITLSFTKVKGAKGYQIKYASNKKYKKAKYKSAKKRTVVLKGLKKGKRYYFKVRAYKLDSAGKRVYSKYSRQMVWTVR
ncbi:MAG: InlB B-repeat-containing protein [Anaerostipes sp.]|nr:InlB B-repeat-containing protein [Anaerostipes sp.]